MLATRLLQSYKPASSSSYKSTILADNPVLFYPLDDVSGTTAANQGSFAGADATYQGTYTLGSSTGRAGIPTGVLLDGTSGYLSTAAIALNSGFTAFSVEYWISPTALGNYRLSDFSNKISVSTSSATLNGIVNGAVPLTANSAISAAPAAAIHVVFTGSASGYAFYINGALFSSNTSAYSNSATTSAYYIGRYSGGAYFFNGLIAGHAVYNYALSAAQVLAHFNTGA